MSKKIKHYKKEMKPQTCDPVFHMYVARFVYMHPYFLSATEFFMLKILGGNTQRK